MTAAVSGVALSSCVISTCSRAPSLALTMPRAASGCARSGSRSSSWPASSALVSQRFMEERSRTGVATNAGTLPRTLRVRAHRVCTRLRGMLEPIIRGGCLMTTIRPAPCARLGSLCSRVHCSIASSLRCDSLCEHVASCYFAPCERMARELLKARHVASDRRGFVGSSRWERVAPWRFDWILR